MDPRRYVILRTPLSRSHTFSGELFSKEASTEVPSETAAELIVEGENLNEREAADLRRDPGVAAAAPVIECMLHTPRVAEAVGDVATTNITWGIRAVGADRSAYDGRGVTVAVLDTGIERSHEAFSHLTSATCLERDFTGEGDGDQNGHGTHCAATIFGRVRSDLRIGVAPGIMRALVGKVLDQKGVGTTENIMRGIQWALAERANIISMSLGIDFTRLVDYFVTDGMPQRAAVSKALEEYRSSLELFGTLASYVHSRGTHLHPAILVVATGNESERPHFTIAAAPPAVSQHALSVGAVGPGAAGLEVASFSNTNPRICAPGVGILSAKAGGGLCAFSGTSMATPHAAGVAALWADHLLRKFGRFESLSLLGKVIGSAVTKPLAPGFNGLDVGVGILQAPRD